MSTTRTTPPVASAPGNQPSSLRLVVYGQGSTENRGPTLVRLDEGLREELTEVAQGQLYLLIEHALRKLIDDLKSRPAGQLQVIDAATMPATPASQARPGQIKRAARVRKAAEAD